MSFYKPKWLLLGFVLIFGVTFFSTYYPSANDLPRGIHQWAQADRLALCYRYVDGKPLAYPATYSMKTPDGDLGAELSIFQYAIAQVIRLGFPRTYLPFLYKFFTFSFFYFALSLLCARLLQKESIAAILFATVVLFSSPVLLHYGYNYLPDMWALSLILFAIYFFHDGISKHIYTILLIAGLSLFIKASSGIYFIAFYSVFFLQNIRKPTTRFWLASTLFLAISAGVTYYDYHYVIELNKRLWATIFLSQTVPLTSLDEFWNVLDTAWRFKNDYFTTIQRWTFLLLLLGGLFGLRRRSFIRPLAQLYLLLVVGIFSIILLFGVQFMNHDYYILATISPALLYLLLRILAYYLPYVHPTASAIILGLLAIVSYSTANSRYFERMSEIVHVKGYPEQYLYKWLLHGEHKIEEYASKDQNIFVCYVPEHNHSLLYFDRKGATFNTEEMGRDESPLWYYLDRIKPSCIVVRSDKVEQLKQDQPQLVEMTEQVYGDEHLTIYQFPQ